MVKHLRDYSRDILLTNSITLMGTVVIPYLFYFIKTNTLTNYEFLVIFRKNY